MPVIFVGIREAQLGEATKNLEYTLKHLIRKHVQINSAINKKVPIECDKIVFRG